VCKKRLTTTLMEEKEMPEKKNQWERDEEIEKIQRGFRHGDSAGRNLDGTGG